MMKTQENESDVDPFLCTCGPCKRFWKDNFEDAAELLKESSIHRANQSAGCPPHQKKFIKVGDRVVVHGTHPDLVEPILLPNSPPNSARSTRQRAPKSAPPNLRTLQRPQAPRAASAIVRGSYDQACAGTVKFVGVVDDSSIAPQLYVGVKLDDNVNSTHNGVYKGKRYFHCPRGHGAMVKYSEVLPLKPVPKVPPITGNYMFPSWEEVKQRRGERYKKLIEIYKNAGIDPPASMVPSHPGSASKSPTRTEAVVHVSDPHDIGLKDRARKQERERKQRETIVADKERQEMKKIKEQFGGREDSDKMAQTLLKLQQAYREGLAITRRKTTWDLDSDKYTDDED